MHPSSIDMYTPFVPDNHISYEAQSVVQKLIKPLQDKLAITYFNYSVTYPDTSGFTLHNNANFYESWFKNEFPMSELLFEPGWYRWETCSSSKFLEVTHKMDIGNGIALFERQNGAIITTAFATSVDNKLAYDSYFNNLHLLKRFSKYFAEKCRNIINIAQKELIVPLPNMIMQVGVTSSPCLSDDEIIKKELFCPFNLLSPREQACFKLLISGHTTLAISEKLKISESTINVYISRMKHKLGCYNKQQLIQKAKSAGLMDFYFN